MLIRLANQADASEACEVIRRSIVDLCEADHKSDPEVLDKWLANKKPERVASWITDPKNRILVAIDDQGRIAAVGGVTTEGIIHLNYVSPSMRFQGVSKMMLRELEEVAAVLGNQSCVLTSTATAERFYLSAGYRIEPGVGPRGSGPSTTRMVKYL